MPPQRTTDRSRPRQDPVSCQLCRSKKLKCDRHRPCSNCSSRGHRCEYFGEQVVISASENGSNEDELRAENSAIKARLRQLEEAVFGHNIPIRASSNVNSDPPRSSSAVSKSAQIEQASEESQWFEVLANSELNELPDYQDVLQLHQDNYNQTVHFSRNVAVVRHLSLPTRDVALTLFDIYAEKVDSVMHILHAPTVRQMFQSIYSRLDAGQDIHPGSLTLLLSVCANAAFYWTKDMYQDAIFPNEEVAAEVAQLWVRHCLNALEQVRVGPSPTLESVQGAILVALLLYHTEGFSARSRLLQANIHTMARELKMHMIDAPGSRPVPKTQVDIVRMEVERKVWWHLTCTDWFLAYVGGPQEGVYSINPRHMKVNAPRNLNPEDLSTMGSEFSRSPMEPTIMSYYHQRIKLATICREVIDALWEGPFFSPTEAVYENVIMLDSKFDALLEDLPPFLRLDKAVQQIQQEYRAFDMPSLLLQRVVVNLMLSSRRCKLHLPFLIRYKSDERFNYSRLTCLKAARTIFAIDGAFKEEGQPLLSIHLKNGGVAQHFFYSLVVLIMDLCINNPEDAERKTEIRRMLVILEQSTSTSKIAKQFFDSSIDMLRKHNINIPGAYLAQQPNGSGMKSTEVETSTQPLPMNPLPTIETDSATFNTLDFNMDTSWQFDEAVWQNFVQDGSALDYQDWDALMTDLEVRYGM